MKRKEEQQNQLRGHFNGAPLSIAAPDLAPDYEAKQQPRAVWDFVEGEVIEVLVGKIYPLPEQKYYARELCYMLNGKYHHDGRWQVTWTEPVEKKWLRGLFRSCVPERLLFSFFLRPFGEPGDKLCFDYIIDEKFEDVLAHDPKEWMVGASGAVDYWLKHNVEDALNGDEYLIAGAKDVPLPGSTELKQIEGKEHVSA